MDRTVHRAAGRTTGKRQRARRWPAALGAAALVAASVVTVTTPPAPASAASNGVLEVLGELEVPAGGTFLKFMGIDPASNRAYFAYMASFGTVVAMATYDLSSPVPKLLSTQPLFTASADYMPTPYKSAIDLGRRRLFTLGSGNHALVDSAVHVVDLDGRGRLAHWKMAERLPGFYATGLTFSPADDRIYVVGEMGSTYTTLSPAFGRKPKGGSVVVTALDPDDGSVIWARAIPECHSALITFTVGTLIARTSAKAPLPELVFACATGAWDSNITFPGQSGVVELRIDPDGTAADAASFDVEFHPISGVYFNGGSTGIAGYDEGSDRMFLASLSASTPGAWVLDARRHSWVGFVTSKDSSNKFLGVHPGTGHFYMGGLYSGNPGYLIVTDARATPPHSGEVVPGPVLAPTGFIATDPGSDRLFLPSAAREDSMLVVRDVFPESSGKTLPDYDSKTQDLEETSDTFVDFTGSAGGYGSRINLIGGFSGMTAGTPLTLLDQGTETGLTQPIESKYPSELNTPSRSIAYARAPSVGLSASGSSATAQTAAIDNNTAADFRKHDALLDWPYGTESCSDGGDGMTNPPERSEAGYAEVTCDLKGFESMATAEHKAVTAGGGAGPGVSVGHSRYTSRIRRSPAAGVHAHSVATSGAITVTVPGVGSLVLGEVDVTASTSAHGRRGTARSEWTRTVSDVVVKDASGVVTHRTKRCTTTLVNDGGTLRRLGEDGACGALVKAVRDTLQAKVRLFLPAPDVVATPKGAYAGVGQSDRDYYHEFTVSDQGKLMPHDKPTGRMVPGLQLDIYNDGAERSRLVLQLAGVESGSIYNVTGSLTDPPCLDGGCIEGGGGGGGDAGGEDGGSTGGATDGFTTATAPFDGPSFAGDEAARATSVPVGAGGSRSAARNGRGGAGDAFGFVFARRGLAQGSLMMSFFVLAVGAAGSVLRRRRLLGLLTLR